VARRALEARTDIDILLGMKDELEARLAKHGGKFSSEKTMENPIDFSVSYR